jgi:hypothetical protein
MVFKPDLKAIKIYVGFISLLGLIFICMGLLTKEMFLTILGILTILYFPVVKLRMKIIINDDVLEYCGLLKNSL